MTVGIGALCEAGQCVIMAADTRGTFNGAKLGPHDRTGKQFYLPSDFCGNIAGTVSVCTSLMSELYTQMEKLPTPFYHDHVRNAIQEAQYLEFANRGNVELKKELCITINEWRREWLPQWLREEGKRLLRSLQLEAQLMVGGIAFNDKGEPGPVLLETYCNDPAELRHFSVIGSGTDAAYDVLVKREQEPYMSFQRTLLHLAEAMEAARLDAIARDPLNQDVGAPGDYVVITPKAYRKMPANNPTLTQLVSDYAGKETETADDDQVTRKLLVEALYYLGVTKKQYAAGMRRPPTQLASQM
jgi:20S proteasome alpha/beta subunit